jgi:hypothetical protein
MSLGDITYEILEPYVVETLNPGAGGGTQRSVLVRFTVEGIERESHTLPPEVLDRARDALAERGPIARPWGVPAELFVIGREPRPILKRLPTPDDDAEMTAAIEDYGRRLSVALLEELAEGPPVLGGEAFVGIVHTITGGQ